MHFDAIGRNSGADRSAQAPVSTVRALASSHDRVGFACVHSEFKVYLAQSALQHARKGVAVATVLLVEDDVTVFAYHTLSASHISPVTSQRSSRVDRRQKGKGYGRLTLMNAL